MVARTGSDLEFDVVLLSDFRFQGGTSYSNAEEIAAQAAVGLSTGLLQVTSPVLKKPRPINPAIQRCVDAGMASFVAPRARARCKLLVVRHPTVLLHSRREMPRVDAERVIVIVNQPPIDQKTGRAVYDVMAVQERARRFFGTTGTWFPIGPLVRQAIEREPGVRNLAPQDWSNIIDAARWRTDRSAYVGDRPVIGRHSRDSVDKWPDTREDILHAYPDDGELRVRVLGGAASAELVLGRLPDAWEVLPFGAVTARDFLAGIDFLVYFHHPRWIEAFGRTILEALASGAPAVLPPHFAELFEDAALYTQPAGVRAAVLDLYGDRPRYQELSRRGVELVERRFGHGAHARRVQELIAGAAAPPEEPARRGLRDLLSRRGARSASASAALAADSVYKVTVELDGVAPDARALVAGMSTTTGERLFELPVDGSRRRLSTFVVTEDQAQRIEVSVETDGRAGAPTVRRLRADRRADRLRPQRLALDDRSVTAAMATYPARSKVAPDAIDSLVAQVDRLFVYLNNYSELPGFVRRHRHRERISFILDPSSERRAAAKFHWLSYVRGYHLICDDDIIYPPDYAARMVAAVDRAERRAIVGVHGVVFEPVVEDARRSRRSVFKFAEPLSAATPVHFLGSGTVALHASVLASMDLSRFHAYPIANDEILAVSAKGAGVPMICVARDSRWLQPHPGMRFGIFEERTIDGGEHDQATQLLASANPWPDLSGNPWPDLSGVPPAG